MAETTIEWTERTWNPVIGCTRISPGCMNCYAEKMAARFSGPGLPYEGVAEMTERGARWTGVLKCLPEKLEEPLRRRKPTTYFVNSMSDLFHERVPFEFIDQVFAVMALAHWNTFQILTKRPDRMAEYFTSKTTTGWDKSEGRPHETSRYMAVYGAWCALSVKFRVQQQNSLKWPLPNVWLGTSVENQEYADRRIPYLLQTPAAVRFLSCEPLLGPVDLGQAANKACAGLGTIGTAAMDYHLANGGSEPEDPEGYPGFPWRFGGIDWVIAGGESGPGARPMHPDWARSLRDQCQAAGVSYFFKQWGAWVPAGRTCGGPDPYSPHKPNYSPEQLAERPASEYANGRPYRFVNGPGGAAIMVNVGKKAAGRLLDDRTWDEMPQRR